MGAFVVWSVFPVVLPTRVELRRADGSVGHYRATVFCVWFPFPEHVHDSLPGWTALYAVEVVMLIISMVGLIMFDAYLIAMCCVLDAQFRTVSAACETIGGRRLRDGLRSSDRPGDLCILSSESNETDHYSDLISHIKDSQNLMSMFEELFDVIQSSIIIQVVIGSFAAILFMCFVCMEIISGRPLMNLLFLRLIAAIITIFTQLFIYCFILNLVETAKSSLNFGLYSCNWTEMNLRFKKTMLLAMSFNSAHNKKMKITPNYVVNREFFF